MKRRRPSGKVYLVGAGPGDPRLISVRGLALLKAADVVISDALVAPELLQELKPEAHLIDAGKRSGHHVLTQGQIIARLLEHASAGRQVVRLKGGDPYLLGRGGEEALALHAADIDFEVIPGVSSAFAVPAAAGIPLTHRDYNSSVTLLTGHEGHEYSESGPRPRDWASLAQQDVLVILMGFKQLAHNMRQLIAHGKSPKTLVAVIQWGTRPEQKTIVGNLTNIAERVAAAELRAPVTVVVGPVVALRKQLAVWERQALFGAHLLVTRAQTQAGELSTQLRALGARVTEIPTIEIAPLALSRESKQFYKKLDEYHYLVLTSVNGVELFFSQLVAQGLDARALASLKIAAIGPATATALVRYGVRADVVAKTYQAEGLLAVLPRRLRGQKIILAQAANARTVLAAALEHRGATVKRLVLYRTRIPRAAQTALHALLRDDPPQLVCVASSSMVQHYATLLRRAPKLWQQAQKIPLACMGPITAQTARALGLQVVVQARQATISALVHAIRQHKKRWQRASFSPLR